MTNYSNFATTMVFLIFLYFTYTVIYAAIGIYTKTLSNIDIMIVSAINTYFLYLGAEAVYEKKLYQFQIYYFLIITKVFYELFYIHSVNITWFDILTFGFDLFMVYLIYHRYMTIKPELIRFYSKVTGSNIKIQTAFHYRMHYQAFFKGAIQLMVTIQIIISNFTLTTRAIVEFTLNIILLIFYGINKNSEILKIRIIELILILYKAIIFLLYVLFYITPSDIIRIIYDKFINLCALFLIIGTLWYMFMDTIYYGCGLKKRMSLMNTD